MTERSPDPRGEPSPEPGLRLGWFVGRSDGQSRVRIELPIGEVVRAAIVVILVWNLAGLLERVGEVVLLLLLAILLATAIGPAVDRLRRGPFTHGMGVLAVYSLMVLAIGLPLYLFFPYLAAQASAFLASLPDRLLSLQPYAAALQPPPLSDAAVGAVEQASNAVRSPAAPAAEQLVQAGATAAQLLFGFVTVFVLAFYWLVERLTIKHALMRILPPHRAEDLDVIWWEVEVRIGGWVRGQAVLMAAIGLMAGVGYAVIGLPNAALLGVFAGLVEIVPLVGPFLAFAPAVLVGLAIDPTKALVTYAAIIQQFEANILVPRVMGQAVGISQLTVLLGILVGSILYGLPGTFIAVPVAAALQVIIGHYTRRPDAAPRPPAGGS
jgi:predicted PurR-regulated permease PerM